MPRKKKIELTPEELELQEIKKKEEAKLRELHYVEDYLDYIPEPTYKFNIGDEVICGNFKKSVISEVFHNGKIYGVDCIATANNYGKPYDYETYKVFAWYGIRPKLIGKSSFTTNQDVSLTFNNSCIESLLHTNYHFGINKDPIYQRDYVWDDNDREKLFDSIFMGADIGKFVLVKHNYKDWENEGFGYEILDGKQRLKTLLDYYENRFAYKGYYYNDLSPLDKNTILEHHIAVADISDANKKDIIRYFLMLNQGGKEMSIEDLERAKKLYESLAS